MEEHLRAALELLEPDETAQTLLSRTLAEKIATGVGVLDRASPLRPTSVLEISGLAGSGKTELLYSVSVDQVEVDPGNEAENESNCAAQIAAACVLPHTLEGVPVGGHGMHVLFFDLDCKFDIFRLATILQARVQEALAAPAVAAGCVLSSAPISLQISHFFYFICTVSMLQALRSWWRRRCATPRAVSTSSPAPRRSIS